MSAEAVLVVAPDKPTLAERVAARFLDELARLTAERDAVHVSLTGGSMGAAVLGLVPGHAGAAAVDFSKVHFWWSDERFLPRGDAERNARQARDALLDRIDVPAANVHEPAGSDDGVTLDEAAASYAAELARFGTAERPHPVFDVCFLGVGPDAHIASLFPGRDEIAVPEPTVLAVRDSPKPPPERVTFSLPVITASDRVWLVASGSDKAEALGRALGGAAPSEAPAGAAKGTAETIAWLDDAAAARLA